MDKNTSKKGTRSHACECSDPLCKAHKGTSCNHYGRTKILYRIDMIDATGTRFCEHCADDAMESGLFDTVKNFYS